jgi:ribonuclease-3
MSQPVVVFRTNSDIEAAVVRGLLDSHGLHTFLSSDMPRALFPLSVSGLGEVRVSVPTEDAHMARRLIAEHRREVRAPEVIPFPDAITGLEFRLGYHFRDRSLLGRALTHRSRANEEGLAASDNESLEFLGDAVLGFVVADYLYHELPDLDEGHKSKIKAALVSRASLVTIAERLDLGTVVRLGRGEEKTGGRQKHALLADTCEAVIAAVYLDGGLDGARALIVRELSPVFERIRHPGMLTAMTGDYKSALQEWLQARNDGPPVYRIIAETGPAHRRRFDVEVVVANRPVGRAEGLTKKEAEQGAARAALIAVGALDHHPKAN